MNTFSRKADRVVDCHVHLGGFDTLAELLAMRRSLGLDRLALMCIVNPRTGAGVADGLCAKAAADGALYCFGGLNHAGAVSGGTVAAPSFAEQVDALRAAGADGIKLIEGKPTCRKRLPYPLDGEYYADLFARAEQLDVPVLWHVGDPNEYWGDPARLPKWAIDRGWIYDDSYVTNEQHYREVANVLGRHPRLRVVFAHFYFLSGDLPRAGEFLADHPTVGLDLSPGIELLFGGARRPGSMDEARAFFIAQQDRLYYGTDMAGGDSYKGGAERGRAIRRFLETEEAFTVPDYWTPGAQTELVGLDLPAEVLDKIYGGNFRRLAGAEPGPVETDSAVELCRRHAALAEGISGTPADETSAGKCAHMLAALNRRPRAHELPQRED